MMNFKGIEVTLPVLGPTLRPQAGEVLPTLSLQAVKAAARLAMAEGRLGYQRNEETCAYRGEYGSTCAIGAAMTSEQLDAVDHARMNCSSISMLEGLFYIAAEEENAIADIQMAHDAIINSREAYSSYDLDFGSPVWRAQFDAAEALLVAKLTALIAE